MDSVYEGEKRMNKMTLDEAIVHAKELSENQSVCEDCREEHKQLAEWLEELKEYKSKECEKTCTNESEYDSTEEFRCSNCGFTLVEHKEYTVGEDDGEEYYFNFKPKYCPNCGSKIID